LKEKFLRKIYGPTNENGIWRIKNNQELDKIIKHKIIINFIRARRPRWLGHIERKQETRMVKAIYSWKPISRRPKERPRHTGRMMLEKIYSNQKCQIVRPLTRIDDDGRNWLRRPKLCIKSCAATIRRRLPTHRDKTLYP